MGWANRRSRIWRSTTIFSMVGALLLSGCTGNEPSLQPDLPEDPFEARFGIKTIPVPAGHLPKVGEWFFVQVNATPSGGLAAFEIEVPEAAINVIEAPESDIRLVFSQAQFIPLVVDAEASIDLWGVYAGVERDACWRFLDDAQCAVFGSMWESTRLAVDLLEPSDEPQVTRSPEMLPYTGSFMLSDDPRRPFVLGARSDNATQVGLLFRFLEKWDEDEPSDPPPIPDPENITDPAVRLEPNQEASGLIYAQFSGSSTTGSRTPDLHIDTGTVPGLLGDERELRLSSEISVTSGWGSAQVHYEGEGNLQWRVAGEMHKEPVDESGHLFGIGDIGFRSVDVAKMAEGTGGSHLRFALQGDTSPDDDLWYEHMELGLESHHWIG